MLTRRDFVTSLPIGCVSGWGLWQIDLIQKALRPSIGSSTRVDSTLGRDRAVLTAGLSESYKILHFCDNHLGAGEGKATGFSNRDGQTLADWQRLVDNHRPDLIIVNGDLWHDNPSRGRGLRSLERAAHELSGLGVPWAFTWGNHDQLDNYDEGHHLLESAPYSLYRGRATHGNYRVEIRRLGHENAAPALQLFFMNTGDQGLTAAPLAWLSQTLRGTLGIPPAIAFFHIPIREYESLYLPGQSPGIRFQTVGWTKSESSAFATLSSMGGIRACFCGHDHLNDYTVRKGPLTLHYGRATGHAGYGAEDLRKGAKLIEISLPKGTYSQTTVFADGSSDPVCREMPSPS